MSNLQLTPSYNTSQVELYFLSALAASLSSFSIFSDEEKLLPVASKVSAPPLMGGKLGNALSLMSVSTALDQTL